MGTGRAPHLQLQQIVLQRIVDCLLSYCAALRLEIRLTLGLQIMGAQASFVYLNNSLHAEYRTCSLTILSRA